MQVLRLKIDIDVINVYFSLLNSYLIEARNFLIKRIYINFTMNNKFPLIRVLHEGQWICVNKDGKLIESM